MDTIMGIIFVVFGLVFAIYHIQLGRRTSEYYYKLLKIRFNEKGYQISFLIGGVAFFVFGLLLMLHIINSK